MTNAFHWRGQPSVFSTDKNFNGNSDKHREIAQQNIKTGRAPATLYGLSRKSDEAIGKQKRGRRA